MLLRLVLACGILLALPGTAVAAPFSVAASATTIGEAGGNVTFTVSCGDSPGVPPLIPALPNTGTLNVSVDPEPGTDYGEPTTASHACLPGDGSSFTFEVPITNDAADEGNEQFTVTVDGLLTVGLIPTQVSSDTVVTIVDDDPMGSIVPVVFIEEPDSGTTNATIAVTLASAPVQTTTIKFATQDLSATAGSDYTSTSGDLVFNVGQTSKTISVPIIGDTIAEPHEGFFVNLTSTNNGSLNPAAKQGGVAIFNNDKAPFPAVGFVEQSVTIDEGTGSSSNVLFNVSLSSPATERAEVRWKATDWTADGRDYDRDSGRLVFQPGQRTKRISVDVKGDRRDEPDEAFAVTLESPVAAILGARKGSFGVITDDDGPKVRIGKPRARGKKMVTRLSCPKSATRCKGKLRAKSGRTRIGRKRFDLFPGESGPVRMGMSRKSREKLADRERIRVKLIAVAADESGAKRKTVRKARLKRRR